MEKHDLELKLAQNRAQLRCLLLPDPETGRIEADVFPRSTAMKVLVWMVPVAAAAIATRSPLLQSLIREAGSRLR